MTLKEREQVVKDLQEIVDNYSGSWQRYDALANALSLINELAAEIKDLEADYDRVYEQAEADIHANMADGGTSCHWCMDKTKADTVNMMQERLQEEFAKIMIIRGVDNNDPNMDSDDVWDALALVTKEMLED